MPTSLVPAPSEVSAEGAEPGAARTAGAPRPTNRTNDSTEELVPAAGVCWLWSADVAGELRRRGHAALAGGVDACAVARRYDGPALPELGADALTALAARFVA